LLVTDLISAVSADGPGSCPPPAQRKRWAGRL